MNKKVKRLFISALIIMIVYSNMSLTSSADSSNIYPDIKAGYIYSIMNCDTGREFGFEGTVDFLFEYTGEDNTYYLKDISSDKYLKISGSSAVLTDTKEKYTFTRLNYNRYLISVGDNAYYDNDSGDTKYASFATKRIDDITYLNGCWFVTAQGTAKPIRIMPLGDSLTYGNDVDVPQSEHSGYRALLSVLLAEKYPNLRFVFVGSQVNGGTSKADGLELYRHEGHNAHTVYYLDYGDPFLGIYQLCDSWLAKYQPDVIILMLGTNDIGLNRTLAENAAAQTAGYQRQLMDKLFKLAPLKMIMLATSPPSCEDTSFNNVMSIYNELIIENGDRLNKKGKEVIYSDVYSLIASIGKDAFCSDNGHMSRLGYDEIAKLHAENISKGEYIQNVLSQIESDIEMLSTRKDITQTENTSANAESQNTSNETMSDSKDDQGNTSNKSLTISIIAGCVAIAVLGAVTAIVLQKKKKKR